MKLRLVTLLILVAALLFPKEEKRRVFMSPCPNGECFTAHCNWAVSERDLKTVSEVSGVDAERAGGIYADGRYRFTFYIGRMFDQEKVIAAVADALKAERVLGLAELSLDGSSPPPLDRIWIASVAAVSAGVAADIASSHKWRDYGDGIKWRAIEANPLFAGADGSICLRGYLLRAGMPAVGMLAQYLFMRKPNAPKWLRRTCSAINFVGAGLSFGVAHRNFTHDGRPR